MKTLYIMKTRIITLMVLLLSISITAQIDRSKQPEPGPAPTINLEVPGEFELRNGMKVLVVENHKLPRVSYTLRIDNPPIVEGDKAGVSEILGAMLGNGTTTISKDNFNEEIDFLGARLSFGPQNAFASSLSKYSSRVLELMADAAMNPLLTEEEFQKEKEKLIENLKSGEKSVDQVAGRVGSALSYGTHHPRGEFISEETINNVTLDNIRAFYQKYFNPNKAYLVVVGDVDIKAIQKQVKKQFGKWKKSIDVAVNIPVPNANAQYTQINFVDMPNAVQSNISITNNVDLKMKDPDYHSVLIANKILGGGFSSYLNMNLREEHGYTYGARSRVGTSRYNAARFTAGASVRNAVTDSAVVEALKEIKRIKTEDVAFNDLKNAKAKYVGDFVLALERPQTIANYALNIKLNNLPEDFYTKYLANINAVTKEDVKRVANKYFKTDNAKVIVVGKGADVLENLEKTGIPIKYFDTYANATEKPDYNSAIPEGVTVKSVMENYLKAVGIKSKAANVSSIMTQYEATTPMGAVMLEEKRLDGKTAQGVYMGGNRMMSMIMTNDKATANKQPLPENMANDIKPNAGLFMELNLVDSPKAKLAGIESVNGSDAYVIEVSGEVVSFVLYYDVETGLKVKEVQNTSMNGQTQSQDAILTDYKDYDGLKFPETREATMMGQSVTFKLKEVKINEGVTDADFD